ncbi:peroxisomal membrane protein pex14 [Ceratobasidium sp. 394]|nr:peroxisomal membrane protein pex14 [Ceratobasidium sp. 394]KAG9101133.1 peroxisomal membrane protein pex14 [Ceratobasidium sp. UAMH 11750]
MADRQELVRNAVTFLSDPKIQSAPLTKRISFLESKGLTNTEIEEAIAESAAASTASRPTSNYSVPHTGFQSPGILTAPPPVPQRDWRDYFIMALVSGGLMYGVAALAKKYIMPHLQPPSEDAFEATSSQLNAQFDEAAALLKQIQEDTVAAHHAVQQQQEAVDSAVEEVKTVMAELRKGEEKSQNEMREIRSEIDNIRDMLPKMLDANKEAQSHSLAELHQEIKSLKALLVTRRPESPSTTSSVLNLGRPSIPAWQLAGGSEPAIPGTGVAKPAFGTGVPMEDAPPATDASSAKVVSSG